MQPPKRQSASLECNMFCKKKIADVSMRKVFTILIVLTFDRAKYMENGDLFS